jgi:hypothetical protein
MEAKKRCSASRKVIPVEPQADFVLADICLWQGFLNLLSTGKIYI